MSSASALRGMRDGVRPVLLYAVLALFSFPTLGLLLLGERAPTYAHDVFDDPAGLPRLAMAVDIWSQGANLWNPFLTAGNDLLVQSSVSPIAPDVVLAFLLGPFGAYVLMGWGLAFAAGLSMHLFLRDSMRLSTVAVVVGAVAFLMSFLHPAFAASMALIPLLLWLSDRAAEPSRRRWLVILALILVAALTLYQSLTQVAVFGAALQLVWTVGTADPGRRRSRFLTWAATWVIALGLFAPVLVGQLVALPLSHRVEGIPIERTPFEAIRAVVDHYVAMLIDIPIVQRTEGTDPRYGALFMGAIGLPLLVLAIAFRRKDRRAALLMGLLVAIPVLDLLGMLVVPIQSQLGALSTIQLGRIRHEMALVVTTLVAIGADVVVRWPADAGVHHVRRRTLVAGIAIAGVVLLLVVELVRTARPVIHAVRHLDTATPRSIGWLIAAAGLGIGLMVVLAAVAALAAARAGHTPTPRLCTWLVAGVLVAFAVERAAWSHADTLLFGGDTVFARTTIGTYADRLALTGAQAFLLDQPGIEGQRVLTFGDHADRMAYQGLRQVDGYQSIYPLTYHGLFGRLIEPQWAVDPERQAYYEDWGNRAYAFGPNVDPELVRLMGARWLYIRGDDVPTVDSAIERFHDGDVTVYEVPDAFPRAFLAGGLRVSEDQAGALNDLAAADVVTLRGNAFTTDDQARAAGLPVGGEAGEAGGAAIVIDEPDLVAVDVDARRPATLVLADVMAPGWLADRDGETVPIATVDGAFRGVAVTPDTRRVVFRYRPTQAYVGIAIAVGSAFTALGLILAVRRRDRRDGPALVPSPGRPPAVGR